MAAMTLLNGGSQVVPLSPPVGAPLNERAAYKDKESVLGLPLLFLSISKRADGEACNG